MRQGVIDLCVHVDPKIRKRAVCQPVTLPSLRMWEAWGTRVFENALSFQEGKDQNQNKTKQKRC